LYILNCLYIALGGALGAVSRYLVSTWITNKTEHIFPWGTFTVNILGSFFLGLIFVLTLEKSVISPQSRMLISIGFLGAFTTFSTFTLETLNIIKEGNISLAFLNIGGSVTLGLLAVWFGVTVAQYLK